MVPFEDHVTEREPVSIFPRARSVDLTDSDPLLEKITPPSRIAGDVRRGWVFLVLRVTRVTWVTALNIAGFSR
jgi:hypothetical protein